MGDGYKMANMTFSQSLFLWTALPLLASAVGLYYGNLTFDLSSLPCSFLSTSLPGRISYPESAAYVSSINSYWSTLESTVKPACIVTPRDTSDVVSTIKLLSWLPLKDASRLAIRGGGHTPWAGSANTEGGITMDLRSMKTISANEDRSIVSVGAGSIWGDVYRRADALGIAVVGGRGSSIGVGGLTLGGMHLFDIGRRTISDDVFRWSFVLFRSEGFRKRQCGKL
jgi:FAD/FMN-containing dehydrogenase